MKKKNLSLIRQNKPIFKSIQQEWVAETATLTTSIKQPLETDKCNSSNKREPIQPQIDASVLNRQKGSQVMVQLAASKEASSRSLTSQRSSKGAIKVQTGPTQLFKTCSLSFPSKKWKLRSWGKGWSVNHLSLMSSMHSEGSTHMLKDKSLKSSYNLLWATRLACNLTNTSWIFSIFNLTKIRKDAWNTQNFAMLSYPSPNSAS